MQSSEVVAEVKLGRAGPSPSRAQLTGLNKKTTLLLVSSCPLLSGEPKAKPRPSECVRGGTAGPSSGITQITTSAFTICSHPACSAQPGASPARTQLCSGVFPFWIPAEGKSLPVSHSTIFIQTMQSWNRQSRCQLQPLDFYNRTSHQFARRPLLTNRFIAP